MIALVRELCAGILADPALEGLHPLAAGELRRLDGPLRVAVVGHVSSGKSTLVNALIGRRIGRTGEGEITKVTTSYVHASERGEEGALVKLAGASEPQLCPLEQLAAVEGIDAEALEPVIAYVDHPLLERLTVIDTPGLFSVNRQASERTRRMVTRQTEVGVQRADAVLFLSSRSGRKVDLDELDHFRRLFGEDLRSAPTNSMFVLSSVDMLWREKRAERWLGRGGDVEAPLELGKRLLRHDPYSREALLKRVWDARPLVGLLAETARCGELIDEQLLEDARALAGHADRDRLLGSKREFQNADTPGVDGARKQKLYGALDVYGLHVTISAVEQGCRTPAQLRDRLLEASGINEVQRLVDQLFRARAELIIADSALSQLEREARKPDRHAARVCRQIEAVRLDDRASPLRRLRALRLSFDEQIALTDERRAEARRLLGSGDSHERLGQDGELPLGELIHQTRANREWWHGRAQVYPSLPQHQRLADEVVRTYDEVLSELTYLR